MNEVIRNLNLDSLTTREIVWLELMVHNNLIPFPFVWQS